MAEKEIKGLKKLRKNQEDKFPKYDCGNCKCKRFSACGCTKKKNKE